MVEQPGAVLCCGEALIDLIVSDDSRSLEEAGSLEVQPGGAPANVAVALARLGTASSFCGVVGDDPFGRRLHTTLTEAGVDASGLRLASGESTSVAFAWKDASGDGDFQLLRLADRLLSVEDAEQAGVEQATALVVGSVSLSAEPSRTAIMRAVELAADAGVPVCFDVNARPTLWPDRDSLMAACEPVIDRARLVKLSLGDSEVLGHNPELPRMIVESLLARGVKTVVLTDGARGVWAGELDETGPHLFEHLPSFQAQSVDPTGAGDAFTAALLSRLIATRWEPLTRLDLWFAAAAGALATTRRGAMASFPTRNEVEAFLSRQDAR